LLEGALGGELGVARLLVLALELLAEPQGFFLALDHGGALDGLGLLPGAFEHRLGLALGIVAPRHRDPRAHRPADRKCNDGTDHDPADPQRDIPLPHPPCARAGGGARHAPAPAGAQAGKIIPAEMPCALAFLRPGNPGGCAWTGSVSGAVSPGVT